MFDQGRIAPSISQLQTYYWSGGKSLGQAQGGEEAACLLKKCTVLGPPPSLGPLELQNGDWHARRKYRWAGRGQSINQAPEWSMGWACPCNLVPLSVVGHSARDSFKQDIKIMVFFCGFIPQLLLSLNMEVGSHFDGQWRWISATNPSNLFENQINKWLLSLMRQSTHHESVLTIQKTSNMGWRVCMKSFLTHGIASRAQIYSQKLSP